MTRGKGRPLGSADDAGDAPDPARLLARTAQPFRVGGPPLMSGAPMPLEANLDALRIDPDTEDTPPTAVPGMFRFDLDWAEEEDDDEPAAPAPPEDDVAAATAEAAVVAPAPPAAAVAAVAPEAKPVATAAPAPSAAGGSMPGWAWLLLGLLLGAGGVGLYLALQL